VAGLRSLPLLPVAAATLATAALFRIWPSLDLWAAGWFYAEGEGFFLAKSWLAAFFYGLSPWITWFLVGFLIALVLAVIVAGLPARGRLARLGLVLAITLLLGPGLLVNSVFKDNWGRARPAQVTAFGGPLAFSPPLVKADQCGRNCSFPAGHPSLLFLGFAVAGAFAGRRRRTILVATVALGALSGLGRMMQGAHFVSDVAFSGFLTYFVAWLAWRLTDRSGPVDLALAGLSAWLASILNCLANGIGALLDSHRRLRTWPWAVLATLFALGWGGLDHALAAALASSGPSAWHTAMVLVGQVSRPLTLVVLLVLATGVLTAGGAPALPWRDRLAPLAVAAIAAYAFSAFAKFFIGRSRPSEWFADGTHGWGPFGLSHEWWSLPSAHGAVAVALAVAAGRLAPRLRWLFYGLAMLVLVSRVWLTAHWFSDVVASVAVGLLAAALARGGPFSWGTRT